MTEFLLAAYPWIKAAHVMSVIAWMAGLFYLPRLFVYHVEGYRKQGVERGSTMELLFRHQERLLYRAIMMPAMVATWAFGLALVVTPGVVDWGFAWPWAKAAGVVALTGFHFWLGAQRLRLADGGRALSGRGYRLMNEVPTLLMAVIVIAVFVRF